MAAFGDDLVPFVQCLIWVCEGDVGLLQEAEVAGSHFPAVGWGLAEYGPMLLVCSLLVFLVPDIA